MDRYNQELVRSAHPPGRANPTPDGRYNLIVIGAGTAGLVTAAGAAGLGAKVALVEKHLMGGDCLNYGCVPSKTLIRASRAAAEVRDAGALGVRIPAGVKIDFPAVMERVRRVRAEISHHDSVERFSGLGVDIYLGEGRFTGRRTVEVDGTTLEFTKAVIATGARAAVPQIEGLADAGYLINETVFDLTELPKRLAVVGAGPIGCELAQAFARLGSKVHLVHRDDRILNREDPKASELVGRALERDGVRLYLSANTKGARRRGDAKALIVECGGKEEEIVVDEILVGVGRAPNVEGLGLEEAGVSYDKRGVKVDDRLRTTNRRVFAAGDVCMKYKFTHAADAAARIVIQNALFRGRKKLSALTVPWCTYTDPEVAHVGIYGHEAEDSGVAVDTYERDFADVDRAIADGEEDGFVKVHVKKGTDRILGATVVARHAGDMIGEITLAIVSEVGLGTIASVIHPYPTQAEAIKQTGDAYNRTRLTPLMRKLFSWWLARGR
ncbi:MAG: mercuric reductase [Planctomycetota bacterium]|jgi:pyruvate/2-oxoglutarate dehydrogenase complex dihydrolipoamide dehydrogenase (E3) component